MKELEFPSEWPVARYRFLFSVERPIHLPDYAGSAIRGAFGRALRHAACMTREPSCPDCPLYSSCPYSNIFEAPAPSTHPLQRFSRVPNPYIIEAPEDGRRTLASGDELSFNVVLFGRALHHLALVIFAIQRAFARNVAQGSAALREVRFAAEEGEFSIYSADDPHIRPHEASLRIPAFEKPRDMKIALKTQLRLQHNGKAYGPKDIEAPEFMIALIRRASLMREFHAERFDFDFSRLKAAAAEVKSEKKLEWHNWRRYSTRQQQGMYLGGVVGEWIFKEVPPEIQPFVYLGQWLHVGKNATFGLGRYVVID